MQAMKKLIYISTITALFVSCTSKQTNKSAVLDAAAATEQHQSQTGLQQVQGGANTLVRNPHQMTFVGPKSGEGYFSADGKKMIFQSEREPGNPFYQMYILDLLSGATQRVSPGFGKTTCGWIHPSLKKVLFSSTHLDSQWKKKSAVEIETRKNPIKGRYAWSFDENYDIFSSDLKGEKLKRLTREKGYDAEGSYSPDGQWIAFASNRSGYTEKLSAEDQKYFMQDPSYMMDIYIMKADGSQLKRLTDSKGYDGGPFFSANGKKITWRRFSANGMTAEIHTMNVDGSDQRQITHLKSMSWAPYFHPSGDYIIFGSSVYGYANFELFIVDTLGQKAPVRVTFNQDFDGLPVFTPNGNQLSWTQRNAKGDSQIFIADWDDVQARKLLGLPTRTPMARGLNPEITADDIKTWVYYLASDEFAGRKTGAVTESIYTQKIADILKVWGFVGMGPKGSFFQSFEFTSGVKLGEKNSLEFVGSFAKKYQLSDDFEPLSFSHTGSFSEAPVVFAGYGIKAPPSNKDPAYDSYRGLDVKGKWVVVLADIPLDVSSERRHYFNTYARYQHKVTVAKNEGAIGIVFVNGPRSEVTEKFGQLKYDGALSDSSLAVLKLSTPAAIELIKFAAQDLLSLQARLDRGELVEGFAIPSAYLKAQVDLQFDRAKGTNVVAKLKVRGATKGIMVGAHGDHLGHGDVGSSLAKKDELGFTHYGADDNASGVAGVMELAHYFADQNKKNPQSLKKDLIVAVWSGEEIGILGSSHWLQNYAKQTKRKASQDISAYLNMDMIGRYRNQLFVQGVGSGDHWSMIAEEAGVKTGVPLVLQEDPYLPTDSMAFYLLDIPAISFFTGSHGEYHSPRDRAELVDYPGTEKVLDVVKEFVRSNVDSSQEMVKYIKVGGNPQGKLEGRSFRVYIGTIPDYSQEGIKGVKISGVSKDSPAEKAGLRDKDIITQFDGKKIENLYDYVYVLQSMKPNKETDMQILRDGKALNLKVTPKLKD